MLYEVITQYNSHNQFILKKPYYITPEGENLYTQYTDSVLYLNGYPTEGFFRYSESYPSYFNYSAFPIKQEYLRHEKYSFTGTQLDSINFSIYDGKSNDFRYEGVTKYYYNNSKIDSSITINTNINNPEKYNLFKSFTQCTYNFKDNNLISVYEANWSITKDIGDENIHYSDTTFTTKTYSDYTNQNNPYNGLFFVYDLREKSLSNNVNNHFEEITTTSNGDTTRIHGINLNFENFNANNYPEVDNSVGKLYYR